MKLIKIVVFSIQLVGLSFISSSMNPIYAQQVKGLRQGGEVKSDSSISIQDTTIITPKVEKDDTVAKALKTPQQVRDSIQTYVLDSLKKNSDLKEAVIYEAADSIIFDVRNKKLFLFTASKVNYEKIQLTADSVAVDMESSTLYAAGKMDSLGHISGQPLFEEGDQPYSAKTIAYNFKSKKGRVTYARTQQGEDYVLGDSLMLISKGENGEDIVYIKDGKFTSCSADHPHYYIKSKKLKIISGDKIISGPVSVVVEDFPLPIVLPFGFFPNNPKKKSGLILPEYGEAQNRGFFLRGLGFYWAVNDYLGLTFKGDIYTRGGWGFSVGSNYNKRYRYNGDLNFSYNLRKFGEKTDPDFNRDNSFAVRWRHSQTISPTASLTGDVTVESSQNRLINSLDDRFFENNLNSSIFFNKRFAGSPFNLSVSLLHNQNNSTKLMNLTLPDITFRRDRWLPFKKRNGSMKKGLSWIENIGLSYTYNFKNQLSVPDSLVSRVLFKPTQPIYSYEQLNDTTYIPTGSTIGAKYYKTGMRHTIPVSTKFSLGKYLSINPSFNYNEYWYINTIKKTFIQDSVIFPDEFGPRDELGGFKDEYSPTYFGHLQTDTLYGFFTTRAFDININTTSLLYGFYSFKGKKELTFRQTFRPTLGFNWRPDFSDPKWKVYETVQTDYEGGTQTYNRFQYGNQGSPRAGESQSIQFGMAGRLEMKYKKNQKTTEGEEEEEEEEAKDKYTKVTLLENFNFSSNYNFAADSLNLAPFSLTARAAFLKNKIGVQFRSTLDPYAINENGQKINVYNVKETGRLFRFTNYGISVNGRIQSKKRDGTQKVLPPEDEWGEMEYLMSNYVDFEVPWKLNLSYQLSFSNTGTFQDTTHSVTLNGDFSLTPKWKIAFKTGFDIQNKELNFTSFRIYRDLHCWQFSLDWVPFGTRKSFMFTLNVKSSTLKDLQIKKRNDVRDRFSTL